MSFCFFFIHFVKKMRHILASILLLTRLKIWVSFSDEILKNLGSNTILVIFIWLFICFLFFSINFLCQFLLAVFSCKQSQRKFKNLALVAFRRVLLADSQVFFGRCLEIILKFGKAEKNLNYRVHIARVTQVFHSCKS